MLRALSATAYVKRRLMLRISHLRAGSMLVPDPAENNKVRDISRRPRVSLLPWHCCGALVSNPFLHFRERKTLVADETLQCTRHDVRE